MLDLERKTVPKAGQHRERKYAAREQGDKEGPAEKPFAHHEGKRRDDQREYHYGR